MLLVTLQQEMALVDSRLSLLEQKMNLIQNRVPELLVREFLELDEISQRRILNLAQQQPNFLMSIVDVLAKVSTILTPVMLFFKKMAATEIMSYVLQKMIQLFILKIKQLFSDLIAKFVDLCSLFLLKYLERLLISAILGFVLSLCLVCLCEYLAFCLSFDLFSVCYCMQRGPPADPGARRGLEDLIEDLTAVHRVGYSTEEIQVEDQENEFIERIPSVRRGTLGATERGLQLESVVSTQQSEITRLDSIYRTVETSYNVCNQSLAQNNDTMTRVSSTVSNHFRENNRKFSEIYNRIIACEDKNDVLNQEKEVLTSDYKRIRSECKQNRVTLDQLRPEVDTLDRRAKGLEDQVNALQGYWRENKNRAAKLESELNAIQEDSRMSGNSAGLNFVGWLVK